MKAEHNHPNHYKGLIIMTILSFVCMYILMYAMVNSFRNVIPNINQFYMAGLMATPMIIIELVVMRSMYMDKRKNVTIIISTTFLALAFFFGIRDQSLVGDKQFLRSMIPHHSAAILMCREANLEDPEIRRLCNDIVAGQQKEIDQMEIILKKRTVH